MPELPEVETTQRGLAPHLVGCRIDAVRIHQPRLRWPVPDDLAQQLQGATVLAVGRRAKYLLIHFAQGTLIIHLGMSGSLRVTQPDIPRKLHDHIELEMSSGRVVRYNDPRRFGAWLWATDWQQHPLLLKLGPEPLEAGFDGDYLWQIAQKRKTAIKPFLMDNHIVVGVGNIYASEALFIAGIDPRKPAGTLDQARMHRLAEVIRQLLQAAIALGGTTLRDFVNSEGKPGYFQQTLQVYGRAGQPCHQCNTTLQTLRLGQRASAYCPQCQT